MSIKYKRFRVCANMCVSFKVSLYSIEHISFNGLILLFCACLCAIVKRNIKGSPKMKEIRYGAVTLNSLLLLCINSQSYA